MKQRDKKYLSVFLGDTLQLFRYRPGKGTLIVIELERGHPLDIDIVIYIYIFLLRGHPVEIDLVSKEMT